MSTIAAVTGREVLDSRGNPTVQVEVTLADGAIGVAAVPSGASTGSKEAVELRDGDARRYGGRGVLQAVANVNGEIRRALAGRDAADQSGADRAMIDLDGTPNKGRLGANAVLGASLALMRASATSRRTPLYARVGELAGVSSPSTLPVPMFNILNGGAHAEGSTDFQEFMVFPVGVATLSDAVRAGSEVYHRLRRLLHDDHLSTTVGDEGGFAPAGLTTRRALEYVSKAIEAAGYRPGEQVAIALDPAATEFYAADAREYRLKREGRNLSPDQLVDEYRALARDFPIVSIEDGLAEDDWEGWRKLTASVGATVQLVGDDLFVTQERFVRDGMAKKAANAVLIKLNQVGTVTETIATIRLAKGAGWGTVISHRSGETEDTTIADLVVGTGGGQIKTGAPARSERNAKYNRLMRIEEELGSRARYAGRSVLRKVQ